jgi:hypothetical protein
MQISRIRLSDKASRFTHGIGTGHPQSEMQAPANPCPTNSTAAAVFYGC